MASAGTVEISFAAETAKFTAELKQVNARLKGMESGFKSLARIATSALGVLSAGALTAFVKSASQAADELGKTADKLGVSTAALKSFQIAAGEAGVGLAQANKLLTESQKRLGEAAAGTGEAAKFIKLLGLNVKELQDLSPDQLFRVYADSINGLSTRSEQLAAANALMGRSAQEAFSLIQAGAPAIDDAAAFVERFGLALDRVSVKQIEQANDALGRVATVSQAAGQRIAAGLAPALEFFANTILDATGNTEGLQRTIEQFGAAAITAFELVANAARSLQAAFFGIAAGGARILQFLTFGDVSESFAASVDANLAKANDALGKIQSIEQIQQTIVKALEDSRARAEAAVADQAAREAAARAGGGTLGGGFELAIPREEELEQLADIAQRAADAQKQIETDLTDFVLLEYERRANVAQFFRDQELQREEATANAIQNARNAAYASGIQALQAFAGQSKKVAIALVAINKARAIASAIQNTLEASTLALKSDPYSGIIRAAAVKAWGFAQVAAIAATGYGEIQAINRSGGAPIGSPSNPVNTQSAGFDQQFGATSQSTVQVIIQGNMVGNREFLEEMIDSIKEEINDRDVVLIQPTSRQAQELVVNG